MELKAKDLKIGNLIKSVHSDVIHTVKGIPNEEWLDIGYRKLVKITEFEALPITEHLLKSLGWNYANGKTEGDLDKDFGGGIDIDWVDGKLQVKSHYEGRDRYREIPHIKYAHQLQNLEVLNPWDNKTIPVYFTERGNDELKEGFVTIPEHILETRPVEEGGIDLIDYTIALIEEKYKCDVASYFGSKAVAEENGFLLPTEKQTK